MDWASEAAPAGAGSADVAALGSLGWASEVSAFVDRALSAVTAKLLASAAAAVA